MKISLADIHQDSDLKIYFNWTCNALMPIFPGAADKYLNIHKSTVTKMAQQFLSELNYKAEAIFRGIILRQPATCIMPEPNMQYLSFSTDRKVAENFANVDGFGSDIIDVRKQLGTYGYVIEYTPAREEILFHYELLDMLPYVEAFNLIGVKGEKDVDGLRKQKEIMIHQPATPFTNITEFKQNHSPVNYFL